MIRMPGCVAAGTVIPDLHRWRPLRHPCSGNRACLAIGLSRRFIFNVKLTRFVPGDDLFGHLVDRPKQLRLIHLRIPCDVA